MMLGGEMKGDRVRVDGWLVVVFDVALRIEGRKILLVGKALESFGCTLLDAGVIRVT